MLQLPLDDGSNVHLPPEIQECRAQVIARADRLCAGNLTLFQTYRCPLGGEVRWNFDPSSQRPTPVGFSGNVDYRDFGEVGDAKVVWELNRHQHLLPLARAYRFTGDHGYAEAMLGQIRSWAKQCPFGTGMNWRSPLELAIRLINWVWAFEFLGPSASPSPKDAELITALAYRHLWDIARKYSRHSSANNHLVGEAAGVFIGSSFFSGLRDASRWRTESHAILCREILRQVHSDGGHRELATGYHLFVLEFFLLAGLVGRRTGVEFPREYWNRLEKMFEFVAALLEGGDPLPMFGDGDDGYVLDLGNPDSRARELLSVGAILYGREDFKAAAESFRESAFWLLGHDAYDRFQALGRPAADARIGSKAFADTGYYLLQRGQAGGADRVSVSFDCGELGFGPIAAHGHADALSFTLRAFGVDIFVDPGTYDYFTYPEWRDYLRSTRAHNTVVVDGRNQSEMLGPFLWGRRATSRCLAWEAGAERTVVSGEHDGYASPLTRVTHRRTVTLENSSGDVTLRDELVGRGEHTAELHLHFAEHCTVRALTDHRFAIDCGRGTLVLELEPALRVTLHRGGASGCLGWVSRGYHHKSSTTTLVACCDWRDSLAITSRVRVGDAMLLRPARSGRRQAAPVEVLPGSGSEEMKEAIHGT